LFRLSLSNDASLTKLGHYREGINIDNPASFPAQVAWMRKYGAQHGGWGAGVWHGIHDKYHTPFLRRSGGGGGGGDQAGVHIHNIYLDGKQIAKNTAHHLVKGAQYATSVAAAPEDMGTSCHRARNHSGDVASGSRAVDRQSALVALALMEIGSQALILEYCIIHIAAVNLAAEPVAAVFWRPELINVMPVHLVARIGVEPVPV
jgi:hypothetical protein